MSNEENRDLVVTSPVTKQISDAAAGTLVLAQMSEQEFTTKLATLKKGRERIATIQRELMEPDIDYGVIPGTPKPTLLKPGAEKLGDFYHLAAGFEDVRLVGDGVSSPTILHTVRCDLHLGDLGGPVVAVGMGSASSWERKYRYRVAELACPKCGVTGTILKSKRDEGWFCWAKKGGCGAQFPDGDTSIKNQPRGQMENPDPWDLDNTILKMAEKRSYVDATLRATATSGLFTQDVEDFPESERRPEPPQQPTPNGRPDTAASTHDAAWPNSITMDIESARVQAEEKKAQAAKPATNPDILPADPSAIVAAVDARVTSMPRPAWADDATALAQKGVQLAQNLRVNGMKDPQRKRLYSILTGMDSSKDMTAEQLAILFANSGAQGTKRLLALLAWTEAQDQLEVV